MTTNEDDLKHLAALTAEIKELDDQAEARRGQAKELLLKLLRAGVPPVEVEAVSPFSGTTQRNFARIAGIEPAKKGWRK